MTAALKKQTQIRTTIPTMSLQRNRDNATVNLLNGFLPTVAVEYNGTELPTWLDTGVYCPVIMTSEQADKCVTKTIPDQGPS